MQPSAEPASAVRSGWADPRSGSSAAGRGPGADREHGPLVFAVGHAVSYLVLATLLRADVTTAGGVEATVLAVVWALVVAALAVRPRSPLAPPVAAGFVGLAGLGLVLVGTTVPRLDIAWLTVVTLTALPLSTISSFSARGASASAILCAAAAGVVVAATRVPVPVRVFEVLAASSLVAGPSLLIDQVRGRLLLAQAETGRAAVTDALTGLLNRRGMVEQVGRLVEEAAGSGRHLAVLVADLDHFKLVNDAHGHEVGDAVLQAVASALASTARAGDLVVRLGGEEIAWIGPLVGPGEAAAVAERARAAVAATDVPGLPRLTTSIGIATARPAGTDPAGVDELVRRLLREADRALYAAKDAGRDRVVVAGPSAPSAPPRPARSGPSSRVG